jgi:hypothetical protein
MFQFGATVKRAAERLSVSPREVTQEDLATLDSWGPYRQFNPQLPTLFAHYRDERHKNDLQRGYDVQEGTNKFLEVKQFLEKFGRPPWEELSDLLAEFDLDFQVAPPSLRLGDPIELRLQTLDGKASVEFHALSSGEKILFQLATALLKVDPVRAIIMRPKLLLLDEMDASLHPKVLHRWIGVLREKVVNGLGITCILTTHSPITVALAPEESLFEMVRAEPRIAKVNKREALNRLTVGLPALSVDYSGRRQVFVEADTDAGSYDRLHTLLKADLQLPLSLNFLSTGIKRGKDELGTGCDAVRTIVGKLEEFGNISTFGLVDWDGQARSEGRVHVLAEGVHYAFDNIILHPLLIGLLLLMDGNPPADGLIKFAQAGRGDPAALQAVADAVQSKLDYPEGVAGTVDVQFLNGVAIRTEKAFCLSNGHKMEEALRAAFPKLKRYPLGGGKLINEVIERVLGDMPGFCPMPIVEAFRRLAAS